MPRVKVEKGLASFESLARPVVEKAKQILSARKLPLTADSPENLKKLEALVEAPVSSPEIIQDFAEQARPEISKRLKAEKAQRAVEGSGTMPIPDEGEKAGLVGRGLDALALPQRILLKNINEKLLNKKDSGKDATKSSQDIAEEVANRLGIPEQGLPGILARTGLATATEFGLDPLNLVGGKLMSKGLHVAAPVVKKAPGVLSEGAKVAANSVEALVRKLRAQTALDVLKKSKAPSTAELLRDSGSKVVKPVGKIVGGK